MIEVDHDASNLHHLFRSRVPVNFSRRECFQSKKSLLGKSEYDESAVHFFLYGLMMVKKLIFLSEKLNLSCCSRMI